MSKIRKRLFILGAVLFSLIHFSSAQITFQKTFGEIGIEFGRSIQQTMDGGYIITGGTNIGAGYEDVYLIKTDANGNSLWTKTFGGTNDDRGYSVQQTTDGGYIITGHTWSFGSGYYDVYLIKTDSNGNLLWSKTFGGTNDDWGNSIQQTTDGGYIIAGFTQSFGMSIYLIKTDANGDSLWTKMFTGISPGEGNCVQQTIDGGYIIAGESGNLSGGNDDIYLIKLDANGNSLWTKTFGGTNYDLGYSVQQTMDGGYIITGYTTSFGVGSWDVYLLKTDINGDSLWTRTFGGAGDDYGFSVQQTMDGGYIITGGTYNFASGSLDVYLIKTNVSGDSLWTKAFGGADYDLGYSVQQTTDGGYIITGLTFSFGAGSNDVYLIKTDANGNTGCNEGSTVTIVTTPAIQVTSPASISASPPTIVTNTATVVGNGGIFTTLCSTVGINKIAPENSFLISLNPSTGNFIISFEGTIIKGNVEILNILGEKVFAENIFNESKKKINLKNVSRGIYFVKVYDGEKYYCKKIIIEQN